LYSRRTEFSAARLSRAPKAAEGPILSRFVRLGRAKGIEPSYAAWEARCLQLPRPAWAEFDAVRARDRRRIGQRAQLLRQRDEYIEPEPPNSGVQRRTKEQADVSGPNLSPPAIESFNPDQVALETGLGRILAQPNQGRELNSPLLKDSIAFVSEIDPDLFVRMTHA
jgi:hypothetical protein